MTYIIMFCMYLYFQFKYKHVYIYVYTPYTLPFFQFCCSSSNCDIFTSLVFTLYQFSPIDNVCLCFGWKISRCNSRAITKGKKGIMNIVVDGSLHSFIEWESLHAYFNFIHILINLSFIRSFSTPREMEKKNKNRSHDF